MCMGMEKCVCVECVGGVHVCERKCMYCMSVDLYIHVRIPVFRVLSNFKSAKMLCVCQVFRNSLVFEVGIYVCRHICVCLCVICMPSQMMPDVFYLSDSPASWWRFAFNVVLSRVTEHTRRQTWAFVASRAH